MLKKDLLSITELAHLRKVSSETLRHYDRIDLLKPDFIDPYTKYRYYSIRQYERLGTIVELRQLGMSLDEVIKYFTNRNLKKSIEILQQHQKKLRQEIMSKIMLDKILKRKMKFIEEITSLPQTEVVYEKSFPERYMITFSELSGGSKQRALAITKLEYYLTETAPILASDRIGVYADESILCKSNGPIPSTSMVIVEKDSIESEYKKIIPAGKYLCMYYNGQLEQYHESFELIKQHIQQKNLQICGKIFQIYKIDVTLTSDPKETIMEIQIPVRDAD